MNIVILSPLWPEAVAELQEQFTCDTMITTHPTAQASRLTHAQVIVMRSPVRLDQKVLETAPDLQLIVRAGSGMESIDLDYARRRNIQVVGLPLSVDSVAEHAFALMFAVTRRIPQLHQKLSNGIWAKQDGWGSELTGRRLGLIGFGRIGQRIAEIAQVFSMPILAYDRSPEKPSKQVAAQKFQVRFSTFEDVIRHSSIVSIQTPLNAQTRRLFDDHHLAMLPTDAILINVGRGGIVDEAALYHRLKSGALAGAALDVFEREPLGDSQLLSLERFVGTPHIAAQTIEAQARIGRDVVRVIRAFAKGQDLRTLTDPVPMFPD